MSLSFPESPERPPQMQSAPRSYPQQMPQNMSYPQGGMGRGGYPQQMGRGYPQAGMGRGYPQQMPPMQMGGYSQQSGGGRGHFPQQQMSPIPMGGPAYSRPPPNQTPSPFENRAFPPQSDPNNIPPPVQMSEEVKEEHNHSEKRADPSWMFLFYRSMSQPSPEHVYFNKPSASETDSLVVMNPSAGGFDTNPFIRTVQPGDQIRLVVANKPLVYYQYRVLSVKTQSGTTTIFEVRFVEGEKTLTQISSDSREALFWANLGPSPNGSSTVAAVPIATVSPIPTAVTPRLTIKRLEIQKIDSERITNPNIQLIHRIETSEAQMSGTELKLHQVFGTITGNLQPGDKEITIEVEVPLITGCPSVSGAGEGQGQIPFFIAGHFTKNRLFISLNFNSEPEPGALQGTFSFHWC